MDIYTRDILDCSQGEDRVFLTPLFGEPVVCTPNSCGVFVISVVSLLDFR